VPKVLATSCDEVSGPTRVCFYYGDHVTGGFTFFGATNNLAPISRGNGLLFFQVEISLQSLCVATISSDLSCGSTGKEKAKVWRLLLSLVGLCFGVKWRRSDQLRRGK